MRAGTNQGQKPQKSWDHTKEDLYFHRDSRHRTHSGQIRTSDTYRCSPVFQIFSENTKKEEIRFLKPEKEVPEKPNRMNPSSQNGVYKSNV